MQQRRALMKEKETAEKVSARAFAQSYLSDLVPAVFTRLSNGGFFYDPIERGIVLSLHVQSILHDSLCIL